MSLNNVGSKVGLVAAGAVAAGALVVGGAALADAATRNSSGAAANGYGGYAGGPDASGGYGQRGGSSDTPVTGAEATKVTDAVKAEDSAVTVTAVRKDPDGSYDVLGTKSGSPVFFDVSADLKTITQAGFGGHGGPGRGGPGQGGTNGESPESAPSSSSTT